MNDDEANLYEAGSEIDMDNADDDYTVKLKAEYGEPPADVKYAVSIYGIKEDEVQEPGKVAALTFGPATGGNYTGNGEATEPSGLFYRACAGTSEANPNRASDGRPCMHWMSWTEIIAQANADPTVFEPCLKNGCTHSVELRLSKALKNTEHSVISGDGASLLHYSINEDYRKWNAVNVLTGGYPASRIRTTLNGIEQCESDTNSDVAGDNLLSQNNALISAFPSELQNAIIPKVVKSDTVDTDTTGNNKTTYDRLWLFSITEIDANIHYKHYLRPNEGIGKKGYYQRIEELKTDSETPCYNEKGNEAFNGGWLRSLSLSFDQMVILLGSGSSAMPPYEDICGISPGFCIGIADAPKSSVPPTAVLYEDGTMIFYESNPDAADKTAHAGIVKTYKGWDTETYTDTQGAPWGMECREIISVEFKGSVKPKSTAYWFQNCEEMTNFNSDGLDTSNVADMNHMFHRCTSITTMTLENLDVSHVTNMSNMFLRCDNLINIQGISNWNVSNVTNMAYMFNQCTALKELDLSNWNVENVTNIAGMFYQCHSLEKLNLSNWNPKNVMSLNYMFSELSTDGSIAAIYANDWTINQNIINGQLVFLHANVPEYDSKKYGGDMCKPISMGGYFADPV